MKVSHVLALSAPLLALAAPTPANSQLSKKAEAESFFLQTDVGWFDGGDKKRATSEKPSTKRRAPADADAESFFLQTDVGWFDGGDKKRASIDKRAPIVKRDQTEKRGPSDAEAESFFLQTDVGWFDGGDKKRATGDARSKQNGCDYGSDDVCEYHRASDIDGRDSDKDIDENSPVDLMHSEMKQNRRDRKRELQSQKKLEAEMRKMRKMREQIKEQMREEMRKKAAKIKVFADAEKAGDIWKQRRKELIPWKTYEEVTTKVDIELEMHYVNEIKDALARAQSIDETPTPLKLGLLRMFKLWSIDHIKHCPYELAPARYIEFDAPFYEWDDFTEEQRLTLRAERNSGHIYLL
ncbi:hypothetical protein ACKAV7_011346 [Fusarium commune]